MEQNPVAALNILERVSFQREQLEQIWDETDFLVAFCKVIAYDKLGSEFERNNVLDLLLFNLNADSPDIPSQKVTITAQESLEAVGFMKSLASLAPSQEIQMVLQSIVAQLAGEIFPSFQFSSTNTLMDRNWQFVHSPREALTLQLCSTSKFIKRWKHILKKAWQILFLIKEAKELIQEADNTINS